MALKGGAEYMARKLDGDVVDVAPPAPKSKHEGCIDFGAECGRVREMKEMQVASLGFGAKASAVVRTPTATIGVRG